MFQERLFGLQVKWMERRVSGDGTVVVFETTVSVASGFLNSNFTFFRVTAERVPLMSVGNTLTNVP
jgi:hypothetical protein